MHNKEVAMTEIINLNKKRKAKARVEKEKTAANNRVKFGRTKAEKQLEKAKTELAKRHIDGHERETDE